MRWFAWGAVVGLLVWHNLPGPAQPQTKAYFGWIPAELLHTVGWVGIASVVLWLVLRCTWGTTR
ncbi:MAG: hypothetical protein AAF581_19305 [Planctomycetota bacterium]